MKQYNVQVEALNLDGHVSGDIIFSTKVETNDIHQHLSLSKNIKSIVMDNIKLEFNTIIGYEIERDDEYMVIGHESDDCCDEVKQFAFHWQEI